MKPVDNESRPKPLLKRVKNALLLITILAAGTTFLLLHKIHATYLDEASVPAPIAVSGVISDPLTLIKDFSYNGQSINPNCFSDLLNPSPSNSRSNIDISTCERVDKGATFDSKNLVYTYPLHAMYSGSIKYNLIAQKGNLFLLSISVSGRVSGDYTEIYTLQKGGNILRIKDYLGGGGDCSDGLVNINVLPTGLVQIKENINPFDFFTDSSIDTTTLVDGDTDLNDSRSSCFGTDTHIYNIDSGTYTFSTVNLGTEKMTSEEHAYPYQACFNEIYNSYIDTDQMTLNQKALDQFATSFVKQCVTNKN